MIDLNHYKNEILLKHVFEQSIEILFFIYIKNSILISLFRPTKTKMKRYEKRSVRAVG
jgi:hypothetical protein